MKPDRIYHADFGSYALWLGVFSLPLLVLGAALVKFGWSEFQSKGMMTPSILFLIAAAIAVLWLSRYQLVFSDSSVSYRSWRRSWRHPYTEISGISASRVQPISKLPIGAYVHFKDGHRELVYTKAFSRAAIKDLFSLTAA